MIFVSAQQDNKYCLWQLYVQMANFRRLGIEKDAVVLLAYDGQRPSPFVDDFRRQTKATVLCYPDTRPDKRYAAATYFHLVSKFLASNKITESIFYHDGDIIFKQLPNFHKMLNDDVNYMSDTSNYLAADLYDPDDIRLMANYLEIDPALVLNRNLTGGAQYLIKQHDPQMWADVARLSTGLFNLTTQAFKDKKRKRPDPWMMGMWTLLWKMWDAGYKTDIHRDLDFTWPTYSADTYKGVKILHNAGVQPHQANEMFCKGSYAERSPFGEDLSFVSPKYASYYYANELRYAQSIFTPGF